MPVHQMRLPREVLIGPGVLDRVSDVCVGLGLASPALVLTGPKTYNIGAKAVIARLEEAGFDTKVLFVERSEWGCVTRARGVIGEFGPRVVLGVGGGKVIDVAKLAASQGMVPFVSVPTAASHDGISSSRASIKDSDSPASVEANAPVSIIADTEIIAKAPHRLTASGCGDIIAKYTAVRDWRLAHNLRGEYYGEYAASLAMMSARLVMKNAYLLRKRAEGGYRVLIEALISCGVSMSIAGSSRPCSGSEHLFSHALDMIAPEPALHGEQCGVGAILMAYLQGTRWRMIKEKLSILGAPTTARELEVEPKYIVEALTQAHKIRPDRYTILGDEGLTRGAAERVARSTGVLD